MKSFYYATQVILILSFIVLGLIHFYRRKSYPLMVRHTSPNSCVQEFGHGYSDPFMLPLRNDNGVFVVLILVGDQPIRCVVDTGSDKLVVASADCKSCDAKQGTYQHKSKNHSMIKNDSILRFGSQEDHVTFVRDDLELIGTTPYICDTSSSSFEPIIHVDNVNLAIANKRTGISNYNVMGLCLIDDDSFIHYLTPNRNICFTIYMHPTKGWLGFGDPSRIRSCLGAPMPLYVSLATPPDGLPFTFFVSHIKEFSIAGNVVSSSPSMILWDTGSNFSGCGPETMKLLHKSGIAAGGPSISLTLATYDGGEIILKITSQTYCWPDGTLLIDAHEPFPTSYLNEMIFVMGSLFIQQYVLEFDLLNHRLGISIMSQ